MTLMTTTTESQLDDKSQALVEFKKVEGSKIAVTTSLKIADVFEKRHDDVLKAIKILVDTKKLGLGSFAESSYKNAQNKKQPMYLLDEKFTTILIMGFTGDKALDWKIKYQEEFQRLRSIVTRERGDESAELNKLYMHVVKKKLEASGKEVKSHHYINASIAINKEVFEKTGKTKDLRKSMTKQQQFTLNKSLSNKILEFI